jgi:ribonuclease J
VLGLATGTQAEANAALSRLARGEHPLALDSGDHVILSSRVIPGHENEVGALEAAFLRRAMKVTTRVHEPGIHVSGHASREEQRRMIELVRPRSFIPLHGTRHHLERHAALATSLGVADALVLENGEVAVLEAGTDGLRKDGRWDSGRVHLGYGKTVLPETIAERVSLAAGGVVFAAVPTVDGEARGPIQLVARGVTQDPEVLAAAALEAERALRDVPASAGVADVVRLAVRRALARTVGYKVLVVVTLVPEGAP